MLSRRILFLCTGNYYRSRMAEEYFNARARELKIDWRSDSRGLASDKHGSGNVGPMSDDARRMLERAGVQINKGKRMPLKVLESDLSEAEIVVAMSRREHLEMLSEMHPQYYNAVRFWDVEDIEFESPDSAFEKIVKHVESLLTELVA
jgi:protein-tyrosine phosphatase